MWGMTGSLLTGRAMEVALSMAMLFANGEPGIWLDPGHLTEQKLKWRVNQFTETEFRHGATADTSARGGLVTNGTMTGFAGAVQFGYDVANANPTYAYKSAPITGVMMTFSCYIDLDDGGSGGAPIITGSSGSSTTDCLLIINGGVGGGAPTIIENPSAGRYRVKISGIISGLNTGIVKYPGNSTRTFRASGYQLDYGSVAQPYQALTTVSTEFMAAFPTHSIFQDAAGTTPVWAPEQPIGFVVDRRFDYQRGAETIANGNFASGSTGWTPSGGWTIASGIATCSNVAANSTIAQLSTAAIGVLHEVIFIVTNYVSGSVRVRFNGNVDSVVASGNGTYRCFVTPTTAGNMTLLAVNATALSVTLVSAKPLPGNHATQSVTGSRPQMNGRVNFATFSEQFDNAIWVKQGTVAPTVNVNAFTAPDGTLTGDEVIQHAGSAGAVSQTLGYPITTGSHASRFWIRAGTDNKCQFSIYRSSGTVGHITSATKIISGPGTIVGSGTGLTQVTGLTAAWTLIEFNTTAAAAGDSLRVIIYPSTSGASIEGASVGLWGFQIEPGTQCSRYQRIAAATDYDAVGFLPNFRFDGVDDYLVTPSIDFSATDKLTVWAGVMKNIDTSVGMIAELSATANSNPGSFFLVAANASSANFAFAVNGTTVVATTFPSIPAPTRATLMGKADISGQKRDLAVNGVPVVYTPSSLGTGNFGNYSMYIGRRAGASLQFSGNLYGLAARATPAASSMLQDAIGNQFTNARTGVY
jgi:hypothetical protein